MRRTSPNDLYARYHKDFGLRKGTLLVYQTGNFYNAFGPDALVLHDAVGLALTGGRDVVGFNVCSHSDWIQRICTKGFTVATIAQTENGVMSKGAPVRRTLLQLDSPGTVMDGKHKFIFFRHGQDVAILRYPYDELGFQTLGDEEDYNILCSKYGPVEQHTQRHWPKALSVKHMVTLFLEYMKRDKVDLKELSFVPSFVSLDERTVENLQLESLARCFSLQTQVGRDELFLRLRQPFGDVVRIEKELDAVQSRLDNFPQTCDLQRRLRALKGAGRIKTHKVLQYIQRFQKCCHFDPAYQNYLFMQPKAVDNYRTQLTSCINYVRQAAILLQLPVSDAWREVRGASFARSKHVEALLDTHVPTCMRWKQNAKQVFYWESFDKRSEYLLHPAVHSTAKLWRYTTPMLERIQFTYCQEQSEHLQRESMYLYARIRTFLQSNFPVVLRTLARWDVEIAFAMFANDHHLVRPVLLPSIPFELKGLRYPPELVSGPFVPNDVNVGGEVVILTGANGSGKSTYMRSIAFACILGHCGCFLPVAPSSKPRLPLCDHLFLRFGKSDNLLKGQSAFVVEATHMSQILRHATPNSVCLIDEWGSSTNCRDGEALARAACSLLDQRRCTTLFATHYFQLPIHFSKNLHMDECCEDSNDAYSFRVCEGAATTSRAWEMYSSLFHSSTVAQTGQDAMDSSLFHLFADPGAIGSS
jgi:DNA mismatch repair ATPase MutS